MRILINGVAGKMGRELVKALVAETDMEICGGCDLVGVGEDIGISAGCESIGCNIAADVIAEISHKKPDVVVDLTNPQALGQNVDAMLAQGIHLVIGTSGVTQKMVERFQTVCLETGTKIVIAPNFAIGAVLMMKFAQMAAAYMPHAEIIEMHHERKLDAPSGTAIRTAELIKAQHEEENDTAKLVGVASCDNNFRGGQVQGIPIHSVRLPGLMAHQQVIFGSVGQSLAIRHDSMTRESFMPGIILAIRKVAEIDDVVYGLENLL